MWKENEMCKKKLTLFSIRRWVASDLQAKLDVLRKNRLKNDVNVSRQYNDVKSMVKYELSEKAIKFKAKDDTTGTRNLLRLHRALEVISAIYLNDDTIF